jgi:hypothetical protein
MKTTCISVAIHQDDQNAIFGEGVITVTLEDEAAGAFLILSDGENKIRIDMDELEAVTVAAQNLIAGYEPGEGVGE